ncbi:MAG: GumC family protein [Phycisphaerales bacterium]
MNEVKAFEREFGPESDPSPQADGSANLWVLLNDRMHGRWKWAISAGLVLGTSFAIVAFRTATISYSARGLVQVESDLPELIAETPETAALVNFGSFMGSQAELMRDARVVADALKSDQVQAHLASLGEDPLTSLREGLSIAVIGGTNLIGVQFSAEDRRLAQAAVNAVMEAYFRIYGPNSETSHTRTMQQIRSMLVDSRRQLADLESDRERSIRQSPFGTIEGNARSAFAEERVAELREEIRKIDGMRATIEAIAAAEDRAVGPSDIAPPTEQDLEAADVGLSLLAESLVEDQNTLSVLRARMSEQHPLVRQAQSRVEAGKSLIESRRAELREQWSGIMGDRFSYAALGTSRVELSAELEEWSARLGEEQSSRTRVANIDRQIEGLVAEIERVEGRLVGLETESEAIRQGRVTIRALAQLPTAPSRDRRIQMGAAGFLGGFGASLASFFLLGTIDRRAFASRQLETDTRRFKPLGVVPDMSRLGDTDEERVLLEDCVHRIRNRIEVRRGHHEGGFALKVSSPFQGDGKTSVAAALAWSYAQGGYRTAMVDADFVGQALSHQFSMRGEPGVREAMRDPERVLSLVRVARPNLDILPAGGDKSVNAGHLQPAAIRQLLAKLRSHYEIVVVDSGPMTASVESLPIIGAVDGVVLVLRRGRNRDRLVNCIDDIRHVGTPYLGAILNYATLGDCQRYSSLSRVSSELEDDSGKLTYPSHPVVSALGNRRESFPAEFESEADQDG